MNQKHYKSSMPLKSKIICNFKEQVFFGRTLNISEGGVLFSKGPSLRKGDEFSLMVDLPDYPDFSDFTREEVLDIDRYSFEREVIRVRAQVMRSFEMNSEGESLECFGCSLKISKDFVDFY